MVLHNARCSAPMGRLNVATGEAQRNPWKEFSVRTITKEGWGNRGTESTLLHGSNLRFEFTNSRSRNPNLRSSSSAISGVASK